MRLSCEIRKAVKDRTLQRESTYHDCWSPKELGEPELYIKEERIKGSISRTDTISPREKIFWKWKKETETKTKDLTKLLMLR